jgi:hypothetical protein
VTAVDAAGGEISVTCQRRGPVRPIRACHGPRCVQPERAGGNPCGRPSYFGQEKLTSPEKCDKAFGYPVGVIQTSSPREIRSRRLKKGMTAALLCPQCRLRHLPGNDSSEVMVGRLPVPLTRARAFHSVDKSSRFPQPSTTVNRLAGLDSGRCSIARVVAGCRALQNRPVTNQHTPWKRVSWCPILGCPFFIELAT